MGTAVGPSSVLPAPQADRPSPVGGSRSTVPRLTPSLKDRQEFLMAVIVIAFLATAGVLPAAHNSRLSSSPCSGECLRISSIKMGQYGVKISNSASRLSYYSSQQSVVACGREGAFEQLLKIMSGTMVIHRRKFRCTPCRKQA